MSTRPKISWSDLSSASVGVWGLGVEGGANLRRLRALGVSPVLVDDHPAASRHEGLEVLATEHGGLEALQRCDVVVKTPGITRYGPAAEALVESGVALCGGMGLWLQESADRRVVCITGTKGKSTTTEVTGHLLRGLGVAAATGGNLGTPPWDPDAPVLAEGGVHVVEVSSFQATDVATSPPIVAVTSLHPDHLDWHGSVERYYADKLSLCSQPGAQLTLATPSDTLRQHRASLGPQPRFVQSDAPRPRWINELGLLGEGNRANAELARAILLALEVDGAEDDEALERAARGFHPLPSRLEKLGSVGGVEFVDDSLATNVLPTLAALEAFPGARLALLVGGYDRGIDYGPLALALAARPGSTLVVTMPDNGPRIGRTVSGVAPSVEVREAGDLAGAVGAAFEWARPEGVVLLSPAAPSFGRFRDYTDRASAFHRAMADCAVRLDT
jgi:UDP-N-acetylmuramoylalanine--D-glutamate ligase